MKLSDEVVASLHGIAPPDPLYTLKQAQPMLGLGDRAMRQAIYEGELRASKLRTGRGRDAWHVSASAIREFRRKRGVE